MTIYRTILFLLNNKSALDLWIFSSIPFILYHCSIKDFHLEIDEEVMLSLVSFYKIIGSRLQNQLIADSSHLCVNVAADLQKRVFTMTQAHQNFESRSKEEQSVISPFLSVTPIGAPWQQLYLLAGKQRKIYVELCEIAPIKLTLRF